MFREPAVFSRQRIEVINHRLVMIFRMRIEQVARSENFLPDGDVIGNHTMAGLRQHLGNPRST